MMTADESKKTDGSAATEQAATEASTEQSSAQTTSESVGIQARIDALTAQLKRTKEMNERLATQLEEEREKNKTEQEKLIDAAAQQKLEEFKAKEFEPLASSAEKMKSVIQAEIDHYKIQLPEEKRSLFDTLPEVERLQAYKTLALELAGKSAGSLGSAANPQESDKTKRTFTGTDFRAWQDLPSQGKLKEYEELKPEIQAAYRENRIDWTK